MAQAKRKQTTRVGRGKAASTRRNSGVKDKYPGYVFLGSVKSDDPRGGDGLSHRLWQAGVKFYFSRNGGRVYVSPGSRDVAREVYKEFTGRKPNSFLASVVEGAGTGIGLGLAGAAALPMVRKAFPGLMRGKANPGRIFVKFSSHRKREKGFRLIDREPQAYYSFYRDVGTGGVYEVTALELSALTKAKIGTKFKDGDDLRPAIGSYSNPHFPGRAGTGERFEACVDQMRGRQGVYDPQGLCAAIGRRAGRINPEAMLDRDSDGYVAYTRGARGGRKVIASSAYLDRVIHAAGAKGYWFDEGQLGGGVDRSAFTKATTYTNYDTGTGQETERRQYVKRNPAPAADAMYESFHGTAPTGYEEILDELHVHGHLAELGTLVSIKVSPQYGKGKGKTYELDFAKAGVLLCSNETGTHLYFRGGNQEVSPKSLGFTGHQATKDLMDLGIAVEITYRTKKGFDNFKAIDYYHQLGEVSKDTQPTLLYDTMNHELQLAGGSYVVLPAGITD